MPTKQELLKLLENKDAQLESQAAQIKNKDAQLESQAAQLQDQAAQLQDQAAQVQIKNDQLKSQESQITTYRKGIAVLQDVLRRCAYSTEILVTWIKEANEIAKEPEFNLGPPAVKKRKTEQPKKAIPIL